MGEMPPCQWRGAAKAVSSTMLKASSTRLAVEQLPSSPSAEPLDAIEREEWIVDAIVSVGTRRSVQAAKSNGHGVQGRLPAF